MDDLSTNRPFFVIFSVIAKEKGFVVENLGDLGLSMRTNDLSVNFMKRGSAVVVGSKDESDAIELYKTLLSKNWPVIISIMYGKSYKI